MSVSCKWRALRYALCASLAGQSKSAFVGYGVEYDAAKKMVTPAALMLVNLKQYSLQAGEEKDLNDAGQ